MSLTAINPKIKVDKEKKHYLASMELQCMYLGDT